MLEALLGATATLEFEEYGFLTIDTIDRRGGDLRFTITVHQQEQADRSWQIRCVEPRDWSFSDLRPSSIWLHDEHVLLWPFTKPLLQLYHHGSTPDRLVTIGAVLQKHLELVGEWFPIGRFLNLMAPELKYLENKTGLFADGPQPLIEAYRAALEAHGTPTSCLPPRPPVRWTGKLWVEEQGPIYAITMDRSYVVASEFQEQVVSL